ncbi:MAG: xanthine dehydrogenase family protein molybdopterin-binding subunit [Bacteroidota bacterium]
MENIKNNSRRGFLKSALAASGGLILGFNWLGNETFAASIVEQTMGENLTTNAYLSIASNGIITIFSPNPEIGQGIKTAFAVIVAEELDADWKNVVVKQADLDKRFDRQLTGGSGAIKHSWDRLRKAGATAKQMLVEAAAQKWSIDASTCKTLNGFVINPAGQKLSYGELSEAAAKLPIPKEIKLKKPTDFTLIGKTTKSVDNKDVLQGKAVYGIDFKVPGMVYAQIQRPPAFGLKLKSMDATAAKQIPGIIDVVSFGNKVAVVGKSTWEIMKARKVLKIDWEKDKNLESDEDHNRIFSELMESDKGEVRRKDGDVEKAFKEADKIIQAEYQCPFLPHNPMEPMNFFADVKEKSVRLVGPTQLPQSAVDQVAKLLNIPADNITLELTKMGGGFGRRLNNDYALEAAELSSIIKTPVKVMWTREDDMGGGIYRPAVRYRFKAAIDKAGNVTGFMLRGVGMNAGNATRQDNFPVGAIENVLVDSLDYKSPITTGPWRAPITNFLAFAEQAFLDEVADKIGKDPIQFRLDLLAKAKEKPVGKITYEPDRFVKVIKDVAEKSLWGQAKKGVLQGFSVYFSHNSYVAQVAEMEIKKGKPTLKKVFAVTDCGIVINESSAKNQVYGAIVDGIGHAMYGKLTFKDGAPQETNFNAYRMIKYGEVPEIEAHFVKNEIDPTGLGEPALPPTGGALANVIFKATGKRLYKQPFVIEDQQIEGIL